VKLLSEAIAIDPRRVDLKPALFRAALEARRDGLAVELAGEYLPAYLKNEGEFGPWVVEQFATNLPLAERVTIARGLGDAETRLGDSRSAMIAYQIAERLQTDARVSAAIAGIRARLEAEAKNNARRPVVSSNLDQDRLVHAKVVAR